MSYLIFDELCGYSKLMKKINQIMGTIQFDRFGLYNLIGITFTRQGHDIQQCVANN